MLFIYTSNKVDPCFTRKKASSSSSIIEYVNQSNLNQLTNLSHNLTISLIFPFGLKKSLRQNGAIEMLICSDKVSCLIEMKHKKDIVVDRTNNGKIKCSNPVIWSVL
jgi:hypothetical protein